MTIQRQQELAELMLDILPKAMQSIREEMRAGRGDHLTVPQFRLLAAIKRDISQVRDLGQHLGVSEAAISRMAEQLCQDKLVLKVQSRSDRREKKLKLTAKGESLYRTIRESARQRLMDKVEDLANEEKIMAMQGLEIIKRCLKLQGKKE
jgi:DNA-binding MarR family transcriptional regulator